MLPPDERARLLRVAREAIAAWATGARATASHASPPAGDPRAGAFVSLHMRGDLRGCIGTLAVDRPLTETVASCAVAAASADPRFPALTASELPQVEIEVSVLGPTEPVTHLDQIAVGRHGLVVQQGRSRGLLLPQVATQWGWDAAEFVRQTCRKAGLPPHAWPGGGATLLRFEADVFNERDLAMPARQAGPDQSES